MMRWLPPSPPQRQRLSGERDRESDYCGQSRTLLVALSAVVGCVHRALFCRTAAKHGAANWDGQRNRIQRQLSQLSPRSNVCDMLGVPASCNLGPDSPVGGECVAGLFTTRHGCIQRRLKLAFKRSPNMPNRPHNRQREGGREGGRRNTVLRAVFARCM